MVSLFRLASVYALIIAGVLLSTTAAKEGNLKGSNDGVNNRELEVTNYVCMHSTRTYAYLRYKTSEAHVRVVDQNGYYPGRLLCRGRGRFPVQRSLPSECGTVVSCIINHSYLFFFSLMFSVRSTLATRRRAEFPLYDSVVGGQTGQFTFEVTNLVCSGCIYDQDLCSTPASVTVTA